jgi:hypothetical protein
MGARLAGVFSKRAVTAVVAAERREWNENFFGKGNRSSLPARADFSGGAQELRQGCTFCEKHCQSAVESAMFNGFAKGILDFGSA